MATKRERPALEFLLEKKMYPENLVTNITKNRPLIFGSRVQLDLNTSFYDPSGGGIIHQQILLGRQTRGPAVGHRSSSAVGIGERVGVGALASSRSSSSSSGVVAEGVLN